MGFSTSPEHFESSVAPVWVFAYLLVFVLDSTAHPSASNSQIIIQAVHLCFYFVVLRRLREAHCWALRWSGQYLVRVLKSNNISKCKVNTFSHMYRCIACSGPLTVQFVIIAVDSDRFEAKFICMSSQNRQCYLQGWWTTVTSKLMANKIANWEYANPSQLK